MKTPRLHMLLKSLSLLIAGCFLVPVLGQAQPIIYDYPNKAVIRLEVDKVFFEDSENINFGTLVFFLNSHIPISENASITGEIPLSNFDGEFSFGNETDLSIGNIGLGVEVRSPDQTWLYQFQVRLPTTSEGNFLANFRGSYADYTERPAAFISDLFAINADINYFCGGEDGFGLRGKGGLTGLFYTDASGNDDEFDLLVDLSVLGSAQFGSGEINLGITSFTNVTAEDADFGERFVSSLVVAGQLNAGLVRPGIVLRFPLDEDVSEVVQWTLGLSAAVVL